MRHSIIALAAIASGVIFASVHNAALAVSVASDPVGFLTRSSLSSSDTHYSIPFTRPPEFVGAIQSVGASTITVAGTPWTQNQFVYAAGTQPKRYYALIGTAGAAKEGHTYFVTANTNNTVTVDTSQDNLTGIPGNGVAQLLLIPYWTPATLFPATDANVSFTPTTSTAAYKTLILIPNYSAPGINLPYAATYFFSNNVDGTSSNVGWRVVGNKTANRGDDPLLPDGYLVVRNQSGAPTLPLTCSGAVLMKKLSVALRTSASQAQDNAVGMVRPFGVTLNASGLNPADDSFVANDQLLLFDNAEVAFNKAPSAIYYYDVQANNSGGWRLSGGNAADRGNDVIPAGSAMVIRKAPEAGAPIEFWTNAPPVQPFKAVSRKNHGTGVFDINLPLAGDLGVECRNGGPTQVVLIFPVAVTFSSATTNSGAVGNTTGSGTTSITLNLTGVTNAQKILVSLSGVTDGVFTNDVVVPIGVLAGDTTGNGAVNSSDIAQTKSRSGQAVTASNCRVDVTLSGSINSSDIAFVKSKSGTGIP